MKETTKHLATVAGRRTSTSHQHGWNLLWPITCVGRRYAYTKD